MFWTENEASGYALGQTIRKGEMKQMGPNPAANCRARLLVLVCLAAASVSAEEGGKEVKYFSDLSKCIPASVFSRELEAGKWQLIRYETGEVSGTMIGAPSFVSAPDVTLPLSVTGWYAVYIGYWNPYFAYDGGTVVKVKLGGEPAFRRFREEEMCRSQTETSLQEVFVDCADLTGRNLVFGKANGPLGQKAYIAYVRLVPLSDAQVRSIQEDRAKTATRRLVATIDGMSYFHHSDCRLPEHVLELVEPYRCSDVGKVLWAANYGDRTNYPSKVGVFMADETSRGHLVPGTGTNPYIIGEKATYQALRAFARQGIIPQKLAARHVHGMGLKFDLMFRLGISGPLPPEPRRNSKRFVVRHPEFRQVLRDGTVVEKASYAFPEVREFMLSLIREATEQIDADGINLCFVRGPHFLSYERPILESFQKQYGEDARKVDPSDARVFEVRARFMTEFVRGARRVLDEVGSKKGKRLELSAWVWPSGRNVWCGRTLGEEGLDLKGWVREGLFDSLIFQEGATPEDQALCRENGCQFVLFTGYRGDEAMSPKSVSAAYAAGVEHFAYWDIDCVQDVPEVWEWLRRVGHRDEMAQWSQHKPETRLPQLKTVEGLDVAEGLQQAAYSGG